MRPLLKPGLRRLWRDDSTLQIGTDPDRTVVLGGLDPQVASLVDALDGTRDEVAIVAAARTRGLDPEQVRRLMRLLGACGALDDASTDPTPLAGLSPQERDRLAPDLAALSVRSRGSDVRLKSGAAAHVFGHRARRSWAVSLTRAGAQPSA